MNLNVTIRPFLGPELTMKLNVLRTNPADCAKDIAKALQMVFGPRFTVKSIGPAEADVHYCTLESGIGNMSNLTVFFSFEDLAS